MTRWVKGALLAAGLALAGVAVAQEPAGDAPAGGTEAAPAEAPVDAAAAPVDAAEAPVDAAEAPVEAADAPVDAAEEEPFVEEETPSPWSFGLISSIMALGIGGFSAVLGIWVDRDKSRPVVFAGAMSVLILAAIFVGMFQSYLDAEGAIQARADLDRMLSMVEEIGAESGDPEIAKLLEAEGRPMSPSAMPNLTPPSARPSNP